MKKVLVLLIFLFAPLIIAYPHSFTIVYTGNSYGTLYPCGSCPSSVGGGLTRRATVIKKIFAEEKNVIVVDSGNFTAGGPYDRSSINPSMDRQRTRFIVETMEKMDYTAAGLGEAEFNFGADFFKNNLKKITFPLLAANLNIGGLEPFYIQHFSSFKIGIIGLAASSVYAKASVPRVEYKEALGEVVRELVSQVDCMILLSSLPQGELAPLLEQFPQIAVVISSGHLFHGTPYQEINDTVVFHSSFQGRKVGVVTLEIEKNAISDWQFRSEELSLSVQEDPEIQKIIPACFKDEDCLSRRGLVVRCQNPGEENALCAYYVGKPIKALLITDKECPLCVTDLSQQFLKDNFVGLEFRELHYEEEEARAILKQYDVDTLPCFIFPSVLKKKQFEKLAAVFEEKEGKLFLREEVAGIFLFLKRKKIPNRIDLFLDLYDEHAAALLREVLSFSRRQRIRLVLHFVPSPSRRGYPTEEIKIALAVKRVYPQRYEDYVLARLDSIESIDWVDVLEKLNIRYQRVKKIVRSGTMEKLVALNQKLAQELGIQEGGVILLNNNRIFKAYKIDPQELEIFFEKRK